MKISGIICEYNPFHYGHLYQIQKTREHGATHVVAVMSGNFVQRGDVALLEQHLRAETAVRCGIDLVIGIPAAFSLTSAERFAKAGVMLLAGLGCVEELSFGSECGDLEQLQEAAFFSASVSRHELDRLLRTGVSYPGAVQLLAEEAGTGLSGLFSHPNNLLAMEYLKAIATYAPQLHPFTVHRTVGQHDAQMPEGSYASASYLRSAVMKGEPVQDYMPEPSLEALCTAETQGRTAQFERLAPLILYHLRTTSPEQLSEVEDVGQGLEYRLSAARHACSLEELFQNVQTKRYPMARIRRILLNSLIGNRKSLIPDTPPFGRILACNHRGLEILAASKKTAQIPFGTSLSKLADVSDEAARCVRLEEQAAGVYGLAAAVVTSAEADYRYRVHFRNCENMDILRKE